MRKVLPSFRAGSVYYGGSESENKSTDMTGTFSNSSQMIF